MNIAKCCHLLFVAVISLILTACMTMRASVTTFYGEGSDQRGTVDVLPIDAEQSSSLAFQNYRKQILEKLYSYGYLPSASNSPQYVVFITYGIDLGKTTTSVVPIYGQTSGGAVSTSGTVSSNYGTSYNFQSSSYQMPTYGLLGAIPVQRTNYTREFNLDIYEVGVVNNKVYEVRSKSVGACGNINAVMPLMIEGVFKKFPNANGKTVNVDINATRVDC